jgi:hypothetical protein
MTSRREFLRLVAVGSAAAMTRSATASAAAARKVAKQEAHAAKASAATHVSAATRTEIDKQLKGTRAQLKTIRDFQLPAGSPVAFVFKPMKPSRSGGH